jgi:branched-subunit amino acid transport protein AzlD
MGGVLGVAVMASVAASRTSASIGSGDLRAAALLTGYHDAFRAGMIVVALGTLAALFLVRSRASAADGLPVGEGVA